MNKPNILLYSVEVGFAYDWLIVNNKCNLCPKPCIEPEVSRFTYYDFMAQMRVEYHFPLCNECFNLKIKDKSLKDLEGIIPLLKMKKKVWDSKIPHIGVKNLKQENKNNKPRYTKTLSQAILEYYEAKAISYTVEVLKC